MTGPAASAGNAAAGDRTRPVALTIAGSDPSGGAGIQADLKTFTALGVYGASVLTALTAQNTLGVSGVFKVPADFIRAQFDAVARDLTLAAIKTGMLGDTETVLTVADLVATRPAVPLVVDPVMVATSGDPLLTVDAIAAVRDVLIPRALLITPNLPEAARLLDTGMAETRSDAVRQSQALLALGCRAVLVKGGHGTGDMAEDILSMTGEDSIVLSRPRIATHNTHGTGCTLSAAIAAGLASGRPLADAVTIAKDYVTMALQSGAHMRFGGGNGPVDHLAGIYSKI
ncbi:MAG: bifunctional hydroxymethylpyrimidine kinase/phosphomethylpyrimidine kinase [Hyphomicrobium sp.]